MSKTVDTLSYRGYVDCAVLVFRYTRGKSSRAIKEIWPLLKSFNKTARLFRRSQPFDPKAPTFRTTNYCCSSFFNCIVRIWNNLSKVACLHIDHSRYIYFQIERTPVPFCTTNLFPPLLSTILPDRCYAHAYRWHVFWWLVKKRNNSLSKTKYTKKRFSSQMFVDVIYR